MSKPNRYLSGVLLVLIGILIGGVLVIFQKGRFINDHSKVKVTTIRRSEKPIFSDRQLQKMDSRFLFKSVADRVTPSVVYITSIVSVDDNGDSEARSFWNRFHAQHARTVGSGVIIAKNGYIVTNNHVIHGAVEGDIKVILNDKRVFKARIVGQDPTTDIAVLKIDASDLPAITLGNSDKVKVGEWVLAIGNPFRLRSTVTAGIVSALSRRVHVSGESSSNLHIDNFIQTDAAINKGNSGGALVNTSGELIGINTAIATENGNYQGYGFAIPSDLVSKVISDLIQFGDVRRALLGVKITGVNYVRAQDLGLGEIKGVEIRDLRKGGPASRSHLKVRDVILKVNGQPVNETNELQEKIAVHHPGDTVDLTIWRDGNILHKNVQLEGVHSSSDWLSSNQDRENLSPGNNPSRDDRSVEFGSFSLGFKVMALASPEDPDVFDLFIAHVYSSTPADRKGLKKGDVIKRVNDKKMKTLGDLEQQLHSNDNHSLSMEIESSKGERRMVYFKHLHYRSKDGQN